MIENFEGFPQDRIFSGSLSFHCLTTMLLLACLMNYIQAPRVRTLKPNQDIYSSVEPMKKFNCERVVLNCSNYFTEISENTLKRMVKGDSKSLRISL